MAGCIEWDGRGNLLLRESFAVGVVPGRGAAVLRPYWLEAALLAAWWPHIPWTPPPGGVEEEQR